MPNIRGLVSDPEFRALPTERQRAILQKTGANAQFIDELLGGSSAASTADSQGQSAKNLTPSDPAFYGDPNDPQNMIEAAKHRGTAAAAGPSAMMLGSTVAAGALPMAAGAVLPGAVGSVARVAAAHPAAAGAITAGLPNLLRGNFASSARDATIGALLGLTPGAGRVLRSLSKVGQGAAKAEATVAELAAARAAAARTTSTGTSATYVPPPQSVGSIVVNAGRAAPASAAAPAGKAFNTIWREFAKSAAPKAKMGEKIWLKLDESGIPVDVLTSGQASRVPSKLKTWVARTW